MARKKKTTSKTAAKTPVKPAAKTASKTVKLDAVIPPPVVTPLKAEVKAATISKPAAQAAASDKALTQVVKKAELIDRAVEKSGLKKRDVKPSVEAAMEVLAEALIKGEELNLPPLGKLRVVKSKDVNNGAKVLTLKLRTMRDGAGQPQTAKPDAPAVKTAPAIKLQTTPPAPKKT